MVGEVTANTDKPYSIAIISFVLACLTLLPYILLFVLGFLYESSYPPNFLSVFLSWYVIVAGFLVWVSFAISVFATYKIIREKRKGLGYAISALVISLLIFSMKLYLSYLFSSIRSSLPA